MKKIVMILISIVVITIGYFVFYNKNEKLSKNKVNELKNIVINKQGVQVEILKNGVGAAAKNGDTVSVHYVGTLESGVKFDSSVDRGIPFEFTLGAGMVIKGWEIGVEGMKIGEKVKLTIPSDLAYGSAGAGNGAIPPSATLIFEVELLEIK